MKHIVFSLKGLFLALTIGLLFGSCGETDLDSPANLNHGVLIKFVLPSGATLKGDVALPADRQTMTEPNTEFTCTGVGNRNNKNLSPRTQWQLAKDDTRFPALAIDWLVFTSKKEYDDVYTLTLRSDKYFGKDKTHTVRIYAHVGLTMKYYKCELDGKEVDFEHPKKGEIYDDAAHLTIKLPAPTPAP